MGLTLCERRAYRDTCPLDLLEQDKFLITLRLEGLDIEQKKMVIHKITTNISSSLLFINDKAAICLMDINGHNQLQQCSININGTITELNHNTRYQQKVTNNGHQGLNPQELYDKHIVYAHIHTTGMSNLSIISIIRQFHITSMPIINSTHAYTSINWNVPQYNEFIDLTTCDNPGGNNAIPNKTLPTQPQHLMACNTQHTQSTQIESKLHIRLKLNIHYNVLAIQNHTNVHIPDQVLCILSYGPKFALPLQCSPEHYQTILELIKSIAERHLYKEQLPELMVYARMHIDHHQKSHTLTLKERYFIDALNDTKEFFETHDNLIVAQADKAKSAIIMDKGTYIQKVYDILSDKSCYQKARFSCLKGYIYVNNQLLDEAIKLGIITPNQAKTIRPDEVHNPRMYGTIKTHKDGAPARPIVNTRHSPGYALNKLMTKRWQEMFPDLTYSIDNSSSTKQLLDTIQLAPNDRIFSFDVVSMFNKFDPKMTHDILKTWIDNKREKIIKQLQQQKTYIATKDSQINQKIAHHQKEWEKDKFLLRAFIKINLHFTEIAFNKQVWKQKEGYKMGTSISTFGCNVTMVHILNWATAQTGPIKLLIKYTDDLLLIDTKEKIEQIFMLLNTFNTRIQFEMEEETDGIINFLNITIIRHKDQTITTKWYAKPMSSNRILSYQSEHQSGIARNTAKSFVMGMLELTTPKYRKEIENKAMHIMKVNAFPYKTALQILNECITATQGRNCPPPRTPAQYAYKAIPYIQGLTPAIKKTLNVIDPHLNVATRPASTMGVEIYNKYKKMETPTEQHDGRNTYIKTETPTVRRNAPNINKYKTKRNRKTRYHPFK